ncbi:hypothetical protein [Streptacidiphilus sp. PAMC 29251]
MRSRQLLQGDPTGPEVGEVGGQPGVPGRGRQGGEALPSGVDRVTGTGKVGRGVMGGGSREYDGEVIGDSSVYVPPVRRLCRSTRAAAMAASGAVKRLGSSTPAVNPTVAKATSATSVTATGHHSGSPAAPCAAVTAYSTPTQSRLPSSAQQTVAEHAVDRAAQRGSAVMSTCSAIPRRRSRPPSQAAAPTTKGAKSSTLDARPTS